MNIKQAFVNGKNQEIERVELLKNDNRIVIDLKKSSDKIDWAQEWCPCDMFDPKANRSDD